jgi:hypothetical protein
MRCRLVGGDVQQADGVPGEDFSGVAGDRPALVLPADAAHPKPGDPVAALSGEQPGERDRAQQLHRVGTGVSAGPVVGGEVEPGPLSLRRADRCRQLTWSAVGGTGSGAQLANELVRRGSECLPSCLPLMPPATAFRAVHATDQQLLLADPIKERSRNADQESLAPCICGCRYRIVRHRCHLAVTSIRTQARKTVELRGFELLTSCMPSVGSMSTSVHQRRSQSQGVRASPVRSAPVAVLSCYTNRPSFPLGRAMAADTEQRAGRARAAPANRSMPQPRPDFNPAACECGSGVSPPSRGHGTVPGVPLHVTSNVCGRRLGDD